MMFDVRRSYHTADLPMLMPSPPDAQGATAGESKGIRTRSRYHWNRATIWPFRGGLKSVVALIRPNPWVGTP